MKGSSYGERDYAFGQMMQRLRTNIGLTQAGLADQLGVSRRAVAEWEAGSSYPKAKHLKEVIELGVRASAFAAEHEEEEIRVLWQAAHQKVLLDEHWLQRLLGIQRPHLVLMIPGSVEETSHMKQDLTSPAWGVPRVDWSNALAVPSFYGRVEELAMLEQWVVEARCRVLSVLGMGGIGKSALAVILMHRVAEHFEVVLWRSLRDAPVCETLIDDCLQMLVPQALRDVSVSLERRLGLLLEQLRCMRVFLALDNLETLLEEREGAGHLRAGFEGYAQLLRRLAETEHQSCLLLTSRERPIDLVPLDCSRAPVRALRLAQMDVNACKQLLAEKEGVGSTAAQARLIEAYAGNPLALNIMAQSIVDLFAGEIAPFLEQGEVVFGGVREQLDEQYARLSALEQSVLRWLAIVREPVTLSELRTLLVMLKPSGELLEAVDGLLRRSLIERGQHPGSFTLQSVVPEYVIARLVTEASGELEQGGLTLLIQHGLFQARAKEYVRQTQERLLLAPVLAHLHSVHFGNGQVEELLGSLLDQLRERSLEAQGYGPANLVALLHLLRGHLRGLDLSHLSLRGVYLQGIELQDTTLAGSLIQEAVFTEAFDAINGVAISSTGDYWAASSRRGEVRVWEAGGQTLHRMWQAHAERAWSLAFSPDGRMLASGSWDGLVKLWEVERGTLSWSGRHTGNINSVAFAPDGRLLASGGAHAVILWDTERGKQAHTLTHPHQVIAVAWSPRGHLLATGDVEGRIRFWSVHETEPASCLQTLTGHTKLISELVFSPDGSRLASASYDSTVKLWEVAEGRPYQTLTGHTERVHRVSWSPDGRLVASGGYEKIIWLWDVEQNRYRGTLQGHTDSVLDLAFTPDNNSLLSCGDSTLRLWDLESSRCIRVLQGNVGALFDVDWSPDGTRLAGGGDSGELYVWDAQDGTLLQRLMGNQGPIKCVAWSPDGTRLVSTSRGRESGELLVWDAQHWEQMQTIAGHPGIIYAVAWGMNEERGDMLVSGGSDGALRWWRVDSGECLWVREAHQGTVQSLRGSPDGRVLASCGDDGAIMLWDLPGGEHLQTLRRDRPYERLNISGVRGLTEAQRASLRALGAVEEATIFQPEER
jgi:WD40 repeat protein/transcriptional regulator with XRE-family HTH domain